MAARIGVALMTAMASVAGVATWYSYHVISSTSRPRIAPSSAAATAVDAPEVADDRTQDSQSTNSVIAQWDHSRCRWHQGTTLQSADWWIADASTRSRRLHPTAGELASLTSLLKSIETQMVDAGSHAHQELLAIAAAKVPEGRKVFGAHVAEDGSIRVTYRGEGMHLAHQDVQKGEYPSFDAALAKEIALHAGAVAQIQNLIGSIK